MGIIDLILYESKKYDANLSVEDRIVSHPLTQSAFIKTTQGELIDIRTEAGR